MLWRIEIKEKTGVFDAIGESVKKDILDLGIKNVNDVRFIQVYAIEGGIARNKIRYICENLLVDPITQEYSINQNTLLQKEGRASHIVEVAYNPGVMDPVEESAKKAISDLGIKSVDAVKTAKKYIIKGPLSKKEIDLISEKLLCNKVVQYIVKRREGALLKRPISYKFRLNHIDIINASRKALLALSRAGQLFLNLEEMRAIKKYFSSLGRNPTDCELETLAQTWSEHCKHKTLRGIIKYDGKTIDNLLKNTVMKATRKLNKKWCVSVFKDNSGVIEFDRDYDICFKVETHNHPSALEPYGGAGTGIGGVIRDPLGTGLGAKPIINTDVFCFGPLDAPASKIPRGVLHPKRIMKGVVAGVRDYGNRMGIPTSNGAILFDERYIGNPLVFCGNVGLIPKGMSKKRVDPGDLIVLVGGRTGRDGIHGATFSSGELTAESESISSSSVQIGNPITEKKMVDTLLKARDMALYKAITDCGGGGLSSAVGEMGEHRGVEVYLEKVPLKYEGLTYTEIWISEAQERMILAVDKNKAAKLLQVFADENVEATVIGKFTNTKKARLLYNGRIVCDLDMGFLHDGIPKLNRAGTWKKPKYANPKIKEPVDLTPYLLKILSSPNVSSKEWVIRQYDHEVQGGSVIKPLVGVLNDGPSDACVTRPRLDSYKGIILSNGINPLYGLIDPYWMAASAIDEALRQVIAVGGDLARASILDNFCWGNTDKPDRLGGLVRAAMACYDTALGYGVPFISGKDSLNNEYKIGRKNIAIPPTLLISCMAVMADVRKAITMDIKSPGNRIYAVGSTFDELGGSHYLKVRGFTGNHAPRVDPRKGRALMDRLSGAVARGLVRSCHDCSEGGIGVACAEMAFAGGFGMDISLKGAPRDKKIKRNGILLFSESNTRFIVEIERKNEPSFINHMKGIPAGLIGEVKNNSLFRVEGLKGRIIVQAAIAELKEAWLSPFSRW